MKKTFGLISMFSIMILFLSGCQKDLSVSDIVSFSYVGYFSDGSVFETGNETITLGSGEVPVFMENALINEKGKKNITIQVEPKDAYGALYDSGKLQKIPKFVFEKIFSGFSIGEKKEISDIEGVVKGTEFMDGNEYVLFEMNPRQTWDVLKYEIKILDK